MLFSWLLAVFLAMLYGCEPQKMHRRKGENPAGIGRTIENTNLPDGASGTVTGTLAPLSGVGAGPYIIHIEGFRGVSATAGLGEIFTLTGVPTGERRVIVTDAVNTPAPALNLADGRFSARSAPLTVSDGKTSDAGAITIAPSGTIRGAVIGASPVGTVAYIPGTWFISSVDAAGDYVLDGVPGGDYRIDVERPDYVKGYSALVTAASGVDVTASTVTIDTPLTPAGAIALDSGAEYSDGRTVRVDISQEPAASEIMLSQDPAFKGASYQPVSETVEYTFAANGKARLYAKFLKNGIYETSPVYDDIYVDAGLPTGAIRLANGTEYTNTRQILLAISCSEPSGVDQMMVSENANFTGASWETFATTMPFTLSADNGEKTLYLKLKSFVGHESAVISGTIGYDSIVPGSPAIEAGTDGYTNTRNVALTPKATSAVAPISAIMLSEQSDLADGAWQSYATSMTFQVSAGDGTKTIYAKFRDGAGNVSQIVDTTVILDTTVPTAPVLQNTPGRVAAAAPSLPIVIATKSTDNALKCYEALGGQYAAWTEVTDPITFQLASADSWYVLQVRGKDRAGNTSAAASLRIFHGDNTILAGNAAQLAGATSRSAASDPLTLTAAYAPYFITGSGSGKSFTDYKLTIAAGSTLNIDSGMTLSLTNLTVSGEHGNPVTMMSAVTPTPAAGDWRFLNLSGSVTLHYLDVKHNNNVQLTASATAPLIADSTFTAFTNMGIQDESTGSAIFTNMEIICPTATISGYYGDMSAGGSKTFTNVVMQGCAQGIGLEGALSVNVSGSKFLGNTYNIYVDPAAKGEMDLSGDDFEYYTSGAALLDLKVENPGSGVTVPPGAGIYVTSPITSGVGPR